MVAQAELESRWENFIYRKYHLQALEELYYVVSSAVFFPKGVGNQNNNVPKAEILFLEGKI